MSKEKYTREQVDAIAHRVFNWKEDECDTECQTLFDLIKKIHSEIQPIDSKAEQQCKHNWIDAKNSIIQNGWYCSKCGALSLDGINIIEAKEQSIDKVDWSKASKDNIPTKQPIDSNKAKGEEKYSKLDMHKSWINGVHSWVCHNHKEPYLTFEQWIEQKINH